MKILLATAALIALALPATAAIAPETFTSNKADRLEMPAFNKSDKLPVNGKTFDGSIIIGYQTGADSITLFRVPLLASAS